MTITLNQSELDQFVRDLDTWRFNREFAMEKVLTAHFGEAAVKAAYDEYNAQAGKVEVPRLGGLKLPW